MGIEDRDDAQRIEKLRQALEDVKQERDRFRAENTELRTMLDVAHTVYCRSHCDVLDHSDRCRRMEALVMGKKEGR